MGVDFILKRKKGFRRGWDGRREGVAKLTLFALRPEVSSRTFAVEQTNGDLHIGEEYTLRARDESIVVYADGNRPVGLCRNAPSDLVAGIRATGGIAVGRAAQVDAIGGCADIQVVK